MLKHRFPFLIVCVILLNLSLGSPSPAATYRWQDFRKPFKQTIRVGGAPQKVAVFLPAEVVKKSTALTLLVKTSDNFSFRILTLRVNQQSRFSAYSLKAGQAQNRIAIQKKYLKVGENVLQFQDIAFQSVWSQIEELRFDLPGSRKKQPAVSTAFRWQDFRKPFKQTIRVGGAPQKVAVFLPAEVVKKSTALTLLVKTSDNWSNRILTLRVNQQSRFSAYSLKAGQAQNRIAIQKKYLKVGENVLQFQDMAFQSVWSQIEELRFDLPGRQKERIPVAAAAPASKASMQKTVAPVVQVSKDVRPPKIEIISPSAARGLKPVLNTAKVVISGRATDESGIFEIDVNNHGAAFDQSGSFTAAVDLHQGENKIVVGATDIHRNRTSRVLTIVRAQPAPAPAAGAAPAPAGQYYALIIGNNNYRYLARLATAQKDARAVAAVLKNSYGFKTRLLLDARRSKIISAMNHFRKILTENDNFLIYYAGHGEYDPTANRAYWLPVDARSDDDTNWIIADTITSNIRRISSKHILIVADSCYSGTLTRKATVDMVSAQQRERYLRKMLSRKSRTMLASGGNEPVSDSGGQGHSVFAGAFLAGLAAMETKRFSAEELYYQFIKEIVAGSSEQTPEYNIIRNSGHAGGDFIFRKLK